MKKYIASIFMLFLTVGSVFAQLDRSKMPEAGPTPEIKIGTPKSFTLKNGLKVFVIENSKLPKVNFSLMLDRAPYFEGSKAGFVSATGALMMGGTKNLSKDELNEKIDFMGAFLNASAGSVSASGLSNNKEELIQLMADVALNPNFKQEELEKWRKSTLTGLKGQNDNPDAISSKIGRVAKYGKNHVYGEFITEESVKSITLEDCQNYYNNFFLPNKAYMAIVGDISVRDAKKLVKKYFKGWKAGELNEQTHEVPASPSKPTIVLVDRPESVQSIISVTNLIDLKKGHEDIIRMSIMNKILGGGGSGRLFTNLREDKAFTYGAYSNYSSDQLVASFSASASVRTAVTDSAVVEFLYELDKIRKEDVSAKELEDAKNNLMGSFSIGLESPSTIASFAINQAIYNLPSNYYTNYLKRLDAVSIADVKVVANKYITPENGYIVIIGNAKAYADKLAQFGEVVYYNLDGEVYTPDNTPEMPTGMTSAKVFETYLDAIGGKEKLEKVEQIVINAEASIQGMKLTVAQEVSASGKTKNITSLNGNPMQTQVFDGKSGYVEAQGQKVPMNEAQVKETLLTAHPFPELKFLQEGTEVKLEGIEKADGVWAYVISLPTGNKYFYDMKTGFKVKEAQVAQTPQGPVTVATSISDYKAFEGILVPTKMVVPMGPQKLEMKVTSVKMNEVQ